MENPVLSKPVMEMAQNHHRIDYVELPATDLGDMKRFYGKAFGWAFEDYGSNYVAFTGAGLEGGFNPQGKPAGRSGTMVILYSNDLAASERAVLDAGGKITERHEFPGGSRFQFMDPSGNELAVWTKG